MIEHEGKQYARVSDIIRPYGDLHWDQAVVDKKAALGSLVHAAIKEDIDGGFPVLTEKAYPYFESYLKWKEAIAPKFLLSEARYFCHEKMITGQVDAVVTLSSSSHHLVDFKTSAQESKVTWPMQAQLYRYLLGANQISVGSISLFIKLDPKGKLPKVFSYKEDPFIKAKCNEAIRLYWEKNPK
jgi:hypothetical protein